MGLLTLEILQDLQNTENIRNCKVTMEVLNKCINEVIELERRYELVSEVLEDRLKELEALETKDRLAELEKVILEYYLAKGYQVGVGGWAFNVEISSDYKSKGLYVYFEESSDDHYDKIFEVVEQTTKEIFDKAFEFFSFKV